MHPRGANGRPQDARGPSLGAHEQHERRLEALWALGPLGAWQTSSGALPQSSEVRGQSPEVRGQSPGVRGQSPGAHGQLLDAHAAERSAPAQQRSGTGSPPGAPRMRLRIATYNVHSCVGTDRRCDPQRTAGVVQELSADVVALQEMTYPADLAIETRAPVILPALDGYQCALGPTHVRRERQFGNVLLSRFPIRDLSRIDISHSKREPRGALHVVLDAFGSDFHVIATHLGLQFGERRTQVDRIVTAVRQLTGGFFAVVGDFNDWLPGRSLVHTLDDLLGSAGSPRSFPARCPLLALDRVWVHPSGRVRSVVAHASALARKASDHLPVVAEIDW